MILEISNCIQLLFKLKINLNRDNRLIKIMSKIKIKNKNKMIKIINSEMLKKIIV